MKKNFELTNKYIVLATPLILFSLLSSIYMAVSFQSRNLIGITLAVVILFLMIVVFIAGWGQMVKSAVKEESPDSPNMIIKNFPSGVGEYFLPVCGFMVLAGIINFLFFGVLFALGMHFIGDIGVNMTELSKAMANQEALKAFLSGLSTTQLMKMNLWNMLIMGGMIMSSFLMFLYVPAMFFSTKNPFKGLYLSIRYIFGKRFFKILGLFLIIFSANFVISILSAILAGNVITNFVMTLVNFYFICWVSIAVFHYYYNNFVNIKLGQIIDTTI